jgi:iron complex outermembrane receptor protein
LTHTRQQVVDNYDPGPLTVAGIPGVTTFIDFDRSSKRTELEVIHNDEIGERFRLVYGGSLRLDEVKSVFLLNRDDYRDVDTSRLFGSLEWRISDAWLLDLGVMVEESSLTSGESSPRVSLIRKFGNRHALRLVASSARRNPILWESEGETEFIAEVPLFGTLAVPTWNGNDDIEPEEIEAYEIGLHSRFESGLESDVKLFSYDIRDHIVTLETRVDLGPPLGVTRVNTSGNNGTTEVSGIELELGYQPYSRLRFDTGLSLVDADSSFEDFEDSIPDSSAFLAARYQFTDRQEISGAYYYVDEISWLDSGEDIPIARRLDLRYAYRMASGFRIELIGQHLLDEYEDYEPENLHDRLVYLRLSGSF